MAGSLSDLVRDLRDFERRGEVVKQLRAELRKPVPAVRAAIKARALDTLPKGGGLGTWVSQIGITAAVKVAGRGVRVTLKGGRNSTGGRSDMRALDRGRVRAPSWGRRGRGSWHSQTVPAGFFTTPATEGEQWHEAADTAADKAFDTIRRG